MIRHSPRQERSRVRVDQILETASELMLEIDSVDGLSTRAIAERSGVPVPTIYRYFADRDAIITALVERDLLIVDEKVVNEVLKLETVSLRSLMDAIARTHFEHFHANPRAKAFWFAARHSVAVVERVKERYAALSNWILEVADAAGFVDPEIPDYGPSMILWTYDRAFEYIFVLSPREREIQLEIIDEVSEMINNHIAKYLTPTGIEGIPLTDFLTAVGDTGRIPFGKP